MAFTLDVDPIRKSEIVASLISLGVSPNGDIPDAATPLVDAAARQPVEVVRSLLTGGADPDLGHPICRAALFGRFEVVVELLKFGADDRIRCDFGPFLLHLAAKSGSMPLAELLIQRGHDVNGTRDAPVLSSTASSDIARLLVSKGADPQLVSATGATALHWAESEDLIRYLISLGISPNVRDKAGDTPMHYAARRQVTRGGSCGARISEEQFQQFVRRRLLVPIEVLLDNRADINARNNANKTPLDVAYQKEVKDFLRPQNGSSK